jgi:hypothetical protein
MKYYRKEPLFALVVIMFVFSIMLGSCVKDILDLTNVSGVEVEDDYNPEFAVPLVHANLSAMDFIRKYEVDDLVRIEDDYLMTIIYKSKDWYGYARDYIEIPDQQFNFGPLVYNTGGSDSIRVTSNILFDESNDYMLNFNAGEEILFLEVKSGLLLLHIQSDFQRSGEIELSLPNVQKDGSPYTKTIPINRTWPKVDFIDTIDLRGFDFDLSKGGTAVNSLQANYTITLFSNSRFVHASDEVNIQANIKDIEFAYIEGYLGEDNFPYSADTMKLSIFDGTEADRVTFIDPKLIVNINNSTGLPIRVDPPYFNSYSKKSGDLALAGSLVSNPIDIAYPGPSQIGQVVNTQVIANKDNSNIDDVVNHMPKYINYDLNIRSNPDGKTYNNFALDTSYIKVNVGLELPAYGRSEAWEFDFPAEVDPLDFDLDMIEEAEFTFIIENEFPIEINVQLYIMDSNETIIDSLLDKGNYLIAPAQIGSDFRTISATKAITKILIDEARLQNVADMRKVKAVVCLSTNNGGQDDVKIYADSRLDVKLGLRTKLKVDLNEL